MKLLADESIDRQIVERLRQDGYAVTYVAELGAGMADEDVLQLASQQAALLVTADKDFGEMVFRQQRHTHGVLLVRLFGLSPDRKAQIVASAIKHHVAEIPGAFSVIMPGTIRIRRQPENGPS